MKKWIRTKLTSLALAASLLVTSTSVAVALDAFSGSALLTEQTFTLTPEEGVTVTLNGMMPTHGHAEAKPADVEGEDVLHAYDITIFYPDGSAFEPADGETIAVSFESDAIKQAIDDGSTLTAGHIDDNGEETDVNLTFAEDGKAGFDAASFSIYVIYDHENDTELKKPRKTFYFLSDHFMDYEHHDDPEDLHGESESGFYESGLYEFPNEAGELVSTQIVKNGETLHRTVMPDNAEYGAFRGWYIVTLDKDKSVKATKEHAGEMYEEGADLKTEELTHFVYSWEDAEPLDETKAIEVGNKDEEVFLAPLFFNYRLVKFLGPNEDGSEESDVAATKIITLNVGKSTKVYLSDIVAESIHGSARKFYGWRYRDPDGNFHTYQTRLSTGEEVEQYLEVTSADFPDGRLDLELEPVFKEVTNIHFEVQATDATPVDSISAFVYDPEVAEGERATISQLPAYTTRDGYIFDGWYAHYVNENGDIVEQPVSMAKDRPDDVSTSAIITTQQQRIPIEYDADSDDVSYILSGKLYLRNELTLHAHWRPLNTANYKVVIWKQKVTDAKNAADADKTYDYYDYTLMENAVTGSAILDSAEYRAMGFDQLGGTGDFTCFHYGRTEVVVNGETKRDQNGVVAPDGSTVVNVYYDRDLMTILFYFSSTSNLPEGAVQGTYYTYTSTDGTSTPQYGFVDGDYVLLTRGTQTTSTFTYYPYTAFTGTGTTNGTYYGYYDNQYVRVYYRTTDGKWYRNRRGSGWNTTYSNPYDGTVYTQNTQSPIAYDGQRYTRSNNGTYSPTTNPTGTLYGLVDGKYVLLTVNSQSGYIWTYNNGVSYTGTRYRQNNTSYSARLTWTGLYGQTLAQNNYSWGTGINTIAWLDRPNNLIQTLLDGFSRTENPYVLEASSIYTLGQNNIVNHYKQTLSGDYTNQYPNDATKMVSTHAPSGDFQFTNKFNGFEVDSYTYGNNNFNSNGGTHISGTGIESNNYSFPLNVYHKRKAYTLTFANYRPGETGDLVVENVLYEKNLQTVIDEHDNDESNEDKIMDPPKRTYYDFAGWYYDASCTKKVESFANETMPAANMIVYAKWVLKHYMVEIDPDGGEMQADDVFSYTGVGTGSEMTYNRVQYGESIFQPQNVVRTYIPAHNGEYVYVNVKLAPTFEQMAENWKDKNLPEKYRSAFYCLQTELESVYTDYFADLKDANNNQLLTREEFLSYCVDNTQHYRKADPNVEHDQYVLEGWHKVNADGTTSEEKYQFGDSINKDTRIRAVWKRKGAFFLRYDPYDERHQIGRDVMVGDVMMSNQVLYDPADPASGTAHYHDLAQTVILQHPDYIPNHYIFRGWQLLTDDGENTGIFYAPGDTFQVKSDYADNHGIIHFEASYEPESESALIVDVVGLVLDASSDQNQGGYVVRGDLNTHESPIYVNLDSNQVIFKDQLNNFKVHLKDYIRNFQNEYGYMLVGWSRTPHAQTPDFAADAVIGVDKNDENNNILYAVWEPTYYLTLENHSVDYDITFNLSFNNYNGTVYCADTNSPIDAYVRNVFSGYTDSAEIVTASEPNNGIYTVTIKKTENASEPNYIKLILPQSTNASYTVSGSIDNAKNGDTPLSSSKTIGDKLSVYNSGGASEQLTCRNIGTNYRPNYQWFNIDEQQTKLYSVTGPMITGNTGQIVAFYTGGAGTVNVQIQGLYYDVENDAWYSATQYASSQKGPNATVNFSDYDNLQCVSFTDNGAEALEIIQTSDNHTFRVNESFVNNQEYKFIGWYDHGSAAPGDITLDGKAGLDGAASVEVPVPNTDKIYYALYVPKADGYLDISHDEKDTSIGYAKYMNVVADYKGQHKTAEETTMITNIADHMNDRVHTQTSVHVSETDDPDTVLTITLGSRSGYGCVHLNTYEGTHLLDIEAVQDDNARVWYINADPELGAPNYNSPEEAGAGYETKHLWNRTVTKTAAELFEDSETIKGLKVLNPLNYYTDFERKYEFVYNYVFRDGETPRKYLVTGSTSEHSTLEDFKHFVLENAPYVSNFGEDLAWDAGTIEVTNLFGKGKVYATMSAVQPKNAKATVTVKTQGSDVTDTLRVDVGKAFPEDNRPSAQLIMGDKQFYRWEITEATPDSDGNYKLVGYCYYHEFTFMVWKDYIITAQYVGLEPDGVYHRYYPDDDQNAYANIEFLKNTRNQWVKIDEADEDLPIIYDDNGNATYYDALITDYSIIFIDHGLRINNSPNRDDYKIGLLYEVVGEVDENGVTNTESPYNTFTSTDAYRKKVVNAIIGFEKDSGSVKATIDGEKRTKFYYSRFEPSTLTHDNRIEFYRGLDNLKQSEELNPNAKYIFNVYAYMKTPDSDEIYISETPVRVQLYDIATREKIS